MSSDITCFHVGIIGPSDTSLEVAAAKQSIAELNNKLSRRGIGIAAHHWTHLPPGIGEPQGYIDESLAWADIDFVIGFMREKFGSPVADANSGTEHEVKLIVELNKKSGNPDLLFYFEKEALNKSTEVKEFAEWLRSRAMTADYSNIQQLERLIADHIEQKIHQKASNPSGIPKIRGNLPTNRRITVEWIISARMTDTNQPIPTLICFKNGQGEEFIFDTRIHSQNLANWISISMGFAAKPNDLLLRYLLETNARNLNEGQRIGQCWLGHMEMVLHKKLGSCVFKVGLGNYAMDDENWPKLKAKLEQGILPLPKKAIFINSDGKKEYMM